METISFVIDDERFNFPKENIPQESLLNTMISTSFNINKDEQGSYILNYEKENFVPIYEYLKNGKIPCCDDLPAFDYFDIDLTHSYQLSLVIEEDMRSNMYKKEFNELYIDNNHGLININEGFWGNFKINKSTDRNLLFNTKTLHKNEWSIIKDKLAKLKKIY